MLLALLQPRVADIKSTLEARAAQIKKLRSKVDNVEDEVKGHCHNQHVVRLAISYSSHDFKTLPV